MKRVYPMTALKRKRLTYSVLAALFLGCFVLPYTYTLVRLRWRIASLLQHAREVRLEEFQGFRYRQVLASVPLTRNDVGAVLAAMPYAPDIGFPSGKLCAFFPHHRIVVVAQDGTITNVEICFHCEALSLKQVDEKRAPIIEMPFAWSAPLRRLFTSRGIAARSHYNDFDSPTPTK